MGVPAGEQGALTAERRRALEEIDPWWCPTWPITWQRAYAAARQWWLESDGRVDWPALPLETVFEGEQLGRWVLAQQAGWPGLEEDQQDLLAAIGMEADLELVAAKEAAEAKPKLSRDGPVRPRPGSAGPVRGAGGARPGAPGAQGGTGGRGAGGRKRGDGGRGDRALGLWLNYTRARRGKLTPGQLAQLTELGLPLA